MRPKAKLAITSCTFTTEVFPVFIGSNGSKCFSKIPTEIYFEQWFEIISRCIIKLCTLERSLGLVASSVCAVLVVF